MHKSPSLSEAEALWLSLQLGLVVLQPHTENPDSDLNTPHPPYCSGMAFLDRAARIVYCRGLNNFQHH